MKYLGITLSDSNLGMSALVGMVKKVAKRVPPRKGKQVIWWEADSIKQLPV
jgi:hypothetical protein